jgi:hypothetical protein
LSLKHKIEDSLPVSCLFSVINSNVYRYNNQSKSDLFYDENGHFKEEIIINNVDGKIFSHNIAVTFIDFNGNLIMSSRFGKNLTKFSRKLTT